MIRFLGIVFLVLLLAGLVWFVYIRFWQPPRIDTQGFKTYSTNQQATIAGYTVSISSPKYVTENDTRVARFTVTLKNKTFVPYLDPTLNCDIVENGAVVTQGAGAWTTEDFRLYPGASKEWVANVYVEGEHQKISSCTYAPGGYFNPNQSVKFSF